MGDHSAASGSSAAPSSNGSATPDDVDSSSCLPASAMCKSLPSLSESTASWPNGMLCLRRSTATGFSKAARDDTRAPSPIDSDMSGLSADSYSYCLAANGPRIVPLSSRSTSPALSLRDLRACLALTGLKGSLSASTSCPAKLDLATSSDGSPISSHLNDTSLASSAANGGPSSSCSMSPRPSSARKPCGLGAHRSTGVTGHSVDSAWPSRSLSIAPSSRNALMPCNAGVHGSWGATDGADAQGSGAETTCSNLSEQLVPAAAESS
mmetsp:Transcript_94724/g.277044  ORF Transcript_94724/g.277044 Transcript_94724/m.277044 type:complete len:266 (-) Transcript_94724:523-1320(-)